MDGNYCHIESFYSFAPVMLEQAPKDRIRTAAHELVMQYSIRSISMDDIAAKVGMSKKTLYQYYKDKDELIEAVVEDVLVHNKIHCETDRKSAKNVIHEVFLSLDMMAEMFRSMNTSVIYDLQKYHPKAFQKFLKHKNEYIYNIIRNNLEKGIEEELYRSDINVEVLSRYRVEIMLIAFNPDFVRIVKSTILDVEQEIILHFLYGVVNLKGHKLILKYLADRNKS